MYRVGGRVKRGSERVAAAEELVQAEREDREPGVVQRLAAAHQRMLQGLDAALDVDARVVAEECSSRAALAAQRSRDAATVTLVRCVPGDPERALDPGRQRIGDHLARSGSGGAPLRTRSASAARNAASSTSTSTVAGRSVSPMTFSGSTVAPNKRLATRATSACCSANVPGPRHRGRRPDTAKVLGLAARLGRGARAARRRRPAGPGTCAARRARGTGVPEPPESPRRRPGA